MKVLNLTYYSLSGVISHIILKNVFKNIRYITCGYEKLQKNIDEIYLDDERLICTNFTLKQEEYNKLYEFDNKFIYVDHHLNSKELKLKDNKNIINRKFSSCLLTYKVFEKFIKKNKKELKQLALLGHIYDIWKTDLKGFNLAYSLNELFWKYNFELFVEKFQNGFKGFNKEEKIFSTKKIADKVKRLKKIDIKGLEIKNSALIILHKTDYDLINDIQLVYKEYDIYFIYLIDKKKLVIKHKLSHVLYDILKKVFKGRDDIEFFGNRLYGTLNYQKVNTNIFLTDLKAILNKM